MADRFDREAFEASVESFAFWKLAELELRIERGVRPFAGHTLINDFGAVARRSFELEDLPSPSTSSELYRSLMEGGIADQASQIALAVEAFPHFQNAIRNSGVTKNTESKLRDLYVEDCVSHLSSDLRKQVLLTLIDSGRVFDHGL